MILFFQHEGGLGLIEDNEIYSNTLAGVWITTGKFLQSIFNRMFISLHRSEQFQIIFSESILAILTETFTLLDYRVRFLKSEKLLACFLQKCVYFILLKFCLLNKANILSPASHPIDVQAITSIKRKRINSVFLICRKFTYPTAQQNSQWQAGKFVLIFRFLQRFYPFYALLDLSKDKMFFAK